MISTIRIAIILCLAAVSFNSCNTENSIASFSKRKYTPGYYADSPGSKPEISCNTSATIVKKTYEQPMVMKLAIPISAKLENIINSKHEAASQLPFHLIKKPVLVEKTIITSIDTNKLIAKDTTGDGLKHVRHKRLEEVGLCIASAAVLVLAFTFIATSVLLYAVFVFLSIGLTVLAILIEAGLPSSIIIKILLVILGFVDFLGFCLLSLEGHQS